jgi:hypothetical protein
VQSTSNRTNPNCVTTPKVTKASAATVAVAAILMNVFSANFGCVNGLNLRLIDTVKVYYKTANKLHGMVVLTLATMCNAPQAELILIVSQHPR